MPQANEPSPAPDAKTSDEPALRALLARGRLRGFVTVDEVLQHLPEVEDDIDGLEVVLATLEEKGIKLEEEGHQPGIGGTMADSDTVDSDDTVNLYLREVAGVPLLTAAEEVSLAQRIERGVAAQEELRGNGHPVPAPEARRLRRVVNDGEAARHHLVRANARLVIAMAKRYTNQGVPFLDLIQEGNIGLMKAADKFDWHRGHKFSTYATWWVRQSITRALADQGRTIRVPVHMSDRIRRLYHTSRRLEQELSRTPTLEELARELGVPVRNVQHTMAVAQRPLSLEKPVGEDQEWELVEFVEDDESQQPESEAARELLRHDLEDVLTSLTQREARVLELRYGLADGHAYTLKEVGEKFGLTRERIRQIENEALARLRERRRAARLADYAT